ncbi:hypothetical protein GGX14DRAFT_443511 [Mycena pura]|uniref:Uncharacterized protein n=1 Tax=Mycena pura TaxID=153505 RepID=A0AAD6VJL1_9AGAR|nr:hypothetical protein GGX14DRAFT_443511 [Mycena pura]
MSDDLCGCLFLCCDPACCEACCDPACCDPTCCDPTCCDPACCSGAAPGCPDTTFCWGPGTCSDQGCSCPCLDNSTGMELRNQGITSQQPLSNPGMSSGT